MPLPILATKLFIPALHTKGVIRPRLLEQLNEGLHRKFTLISAPAGFGKTTLVTQWATQTERSVAWLSLDQGENNPTQFLAYLIAAIQKVAPQVGISLLAALHTSQPPPTDLILTMLLNDLSHLSTQCLLILDDYHCIDSKIVDADLYYFIDHLPSSLHLVMITREDPDFPLARLRALGQLTEIRANDLRFTPEEAITFANEVMGLNLSIEESEALDARTEGSRYRNCFAFL
jgi:LuxR family maltose regulon positive regulatory protein